MYLLKELDYIYYYLIYPTHTFDSYGTSYYREAKQNYFSRIDIETLNGMKLDENLINQRTLINLLQYYLILNNYHIYNDDIYEKIKGSIISYKLIGSLIDILYNKFQENIVMFYMIHFKAYFDGLNFNYLLTTYFIKSKSIIESLKDISTNKIEPDFSLIEFSDGIYCINYDKFISLKELDGKQISKVTIKYYNKSYN